MIFVLEGLENKKVVVGVGSGVWEVYFVYFILEMGEMLIGGVGGEVFWKCAELENPVFGCDGIFKGVGVK